MQGCKRDSQYKIQDYDYILILYGGTDIGYHWSLLLAVNPWAAKGVNNTLWHFDAYNYGPEK